MSKHYKEIIQHYENCLKQHGDNHLGVDWPKLEDVDKRYRVMLDIIKFNEERDVVSVLDFGCGTAHLLNYIRENKIANIEYTGLDLSEKFIAVAQEKYPDTRFYCKDILENGDDVPNFDYIVMNGVFTEKRSLTFDEMWNYFMKMVTVVFNKCNKGIAFNVMSKHVDWEREDLFHVPFDLLGNFLCKNLTRNFVIRNDYGLYEYTVYILK